MNGSGKETSKSRLPGHETLLLLLLIAEIAYFSTVGIRSRTADNVANIVRLSVEIGLALVMAPIILTGGIDLSAGSLLGLCAVLFGKLWRDAGLPPWLAGVCTIGFGTMCGGFNALLPARPQVLAAV